MESETGCNELCCECRSVKGSLAVSAKGVISTMIFVSRDGCGRREEVCPPDEKPLVVSGECESAAFEGEDV